METDRWASLGDPKPVVLKISSCVIVRVMNVIYIYILLKITEPILHFLLLF